MYYLRYKDLFLPKPIKMQYKLKGERRLILRDLMGNPLIDTGWGDNLIMTPALDAWAVGTAASNDWGMNQGWVYWTIGDGATAPTYMDRYLDNQLAFASDLTGIDGYEVYNNNDPIGEYGWGTYEHKRFAAGVGTGTIRECGVASGSSSIVQGHWARQLVSPAITKGSENILDVYWKFRGYIDLTDDTGQVTIEGETYNYTVRPVYLTGNGNIMSYIKPDAALSGNRRFAGDSQLTSFNNNFSVPSYSSVQSIDSVSVDNNAYVKGSYYNRVLASWGVDTVAPDDTVKAAWWAMWPGSTACWCKILFESTVDSGGVFKDNERTMNVEVDVSWARRAGS